MAGANTYGKTLYNLGAKQIDFTADTFKVVLLSSAYVPDVDVHGFKSDLTGEVAGTGYTAGGLTLTGVTWNYDAASNTMFADAADPLWTAITVTFRHAVFYDATPATDATRPLISYMDFGADQVISGTDLQLGLDPTGFFAGWL